jgi:hypothetical protein
MQLVYSTNNLQDANRLSSILSSAGISNHVSGTNSAQLPGFSAARTPSSISVWVANTSDLPQTEQVMLAAGFISKPSNDSAPVRRYSPLLLALVVAIIMSIVGLLVSGGA